MLIALGGNLGIGEVKPQEALDHGGVKSRVGHAGGAIVGLADEEFEAFQHLCFIAVVKGKIQVAALPVFLAVDEIVQQDVQAADPGKVSLPGPLYDGIVQFFTAGQAQQGK